MDEIIMRRPDDWHVHLRDGAMLEAVLPFNAWSALIKPTQNELDEPKPVPGGISAKVVISTGKSISMSFNASRTIGCSISSIRFLNSTLLQLTLYLYSTIPNCLLTTT